MKLDETDRKLIALLARNARLTNRELARQIGLSPSACLARVKRLERARVILGYRAIVTTEGSGAQMEGWADIRLLDPTQEAVTRFSQMVALSDAVIEAHQVAGHYDYLLRFQAGDSAAWRDFRQSLDELGCPAQARFSVLLEPLK